MKTQEFIKLLEENPTKELKFEYQDGHYVPMPYHITEIKNVHIDSVDCGGNAHTYKQTVFQLWINQGENKKENMDGRKVLKIIDIVNKAKAINKEAEIFFEYGNEQLPVSNYSVLGTQLGDDEIAIQFYSKPTMCKPLELVADTTCCSGTNSCC